MGGRRLEKPGGVFAGIRWGFFRADNDEDTCRSFAAVEWHDSDRLLGRLVTALTAKIIRARITVTGYAEPVEHKRYQAAPWANYASDNRQWISWEVQNAGLEAMVDALLPLNEEPKRARKGGDWTLSL